MAPTKSTSRKPQRRPATRKSGSGKGSSVNRRVLSLIWLAAACAMALMFVCMPKPGEFAASECNPTELHLAAESGRKAAAAVSATTEPGSMARENAILNIRARETKLRRAGFPTAADSFAVAAERQLKRDKVI